MSRLGEMSEGMEDREVSSEMKEAIGRAKVWEIRDALGKKAIWMCREYKDKLLDVQDDPLGLDEFFPCPMPAYGTKDNRKLVPIPDYLQYEKLADEMDDQTRRISVLTSALRAAGAYDSNLEGLGRSPERQRERRQRDDPHHQLGGGAGRGHQPAHLMDAVEGDRGDADLSLRRPGSNQGRDVRSLWHGRHHAGLGRSSGEAGTVETEGAVRLTASGGEGQGWSRRVRETRWRSRPRSWPSTTRTGSLRELSGFDFMPEVTLMKQDPQKAHLVEVLFEKAIKLLKDERMRGFRLDVETNSDDPRRRR